MPEWTKWTIGEIDVQLCIIDGHWNAALPAMDCDEAHDLLQSVQSGDWHMGNMPDRSDDRIGARCSDRIFPDKLTFRPGTLSDALAYGLLETGETPSEYLRRLIATDCGVAVPDMRRGNMQIGEQSAKGVAARRLAKNRNRP